MPGSSLQQCEANTIIAAAASSTCCGSMAFGMMMAGLQTGHQNPERLFLTTGAMRPTGIATLAGMPFLWKQPTLIVGIVAHGMSRRLLSGMA